MLIKFNIKPLFQFYLCIGKMYDAGADRLYRQGICIAWGKYYKYHIGWYKSLT